MNQANGKHPGSPVFVAGWIQEILRGNPIIYQNQVFEADLSTNTIYYKNGEFRLPKQKGAPLGARTSIRSCANIH